MKEFFKKLFLNKVKEKVVDFFLDLFKDTVLEGIEDYKEKRKTDKAQKI